MHKRATVNMALPKANKVAKILGVSNRRVVKLVKLMDSIAISDSVSIGATRQSKGYFAKKKTKKKK